MKTRTTRSDRPKIPTTRNGRKRRVGALTTEFAMMLPLLFFFFFSAFEFCRVAMIRHTVDNAVYEGCRRAIVPGASAADARSAASVVLASLGLHETTISVAPSVITNQTDEVTVSIEVALDQNTFVPPQFTGGQSVTRSLTMRREGMGR